ncbi:cation:proton antiporter [bacterium]|nr:cation:proton antiporter [bacterium]RQV94303.1 MAG: sodium:proton exchanger [bacterium]
MGELNTLIYLACAAIVAFCVKRLTGKIGIPIVTGYVIVGVIMGISLLRIFHTESLDRLDIVNDFALGIIGFTIGSELRREIFVRLGKSIILIALFESTLSFLVVTVSIFLLDPSKVYQAFILGAVASATAPAATVYIIQQYKAKGPLSSTILAVVGIDDAFALIIFVFAAALSKGLLKAEHVSLLSILLPSILEILLSLVSGGLLGFGFIWLFQKVRYPDDLLLGTGAFVLFLLGFSQQFHLSGLLSTMTFGAVVSNLNPMLTNRSSKVLENVSPLLFAFFFIFAGAHLDVGLLPQIGVVGLVYLVARIAGKIGGARLGATIGRAPSVVKKYAGFSLIPQVGVALALAIIVRKEFGSGDFGEPGRLLASVVINVLLFTTIITEIVGPLLTKYALTKAGERNDQ